METISAPLYAFLGNFSLFTASTSSTILPKCSFPAQAFFSNMNAHLFIIFFFFIDGVVCIMFNVVHIYVHVHVENRLFSANVALFSMLNQPDCC